MAATDDNTPAPADFDGLDFTPVPVDLDRCRRPTPDRPTHALPITFRPKAEMLKKANEPLYILRELRKLGELDLAAQTDYCPR